MEFVSVKSVLDAIDDVIIEARKVYDNEQGAGAFEGTDEVAMLCVLGTCGRVAAAVKKIPPMQAN